MTVQIHSLSGSDWLRWRNLRICAVTDAPESFRATLEEERARTDGEWREMVAATAAHDRGNTWIAEYNGDDIGMAFAAIDESYTSVRIGAMWVAPAARRQGVGTALLDSVIEWARSCGVSSIELWVTESNLDALGFYESYGFSRTDETDVLRSGSNLAVRKLSRPIRIEPK